MNRLAGALTYPYRPQSARVADMLKDLAELKGRRITLHLTMFPAAGVAMRTCAFIGAVYFGLFGGYRPTALPDGSQTAARRS